MSFESVVPIGPDRGHGWCQSTARVGRLGQPSHAGPRGDRSGSVTRGLCPGGICDTERLAGPRYLAAALRRCAQYAFMRRLIAFFCAVFILRRGRVGACAARC